MSNGFDKFYRDLDAAEKKIYKQMTDVYTKHGIKLFNSLIIQSPVISGVLRGNYQGSINYPKPGVKFTGPYKEGEVNYTEDPNPIFNRAKLTDIMYITNNTEYAQKLEEGSVRQRPVGWHRITVASAQKFLDAALNEVERGG